LAVHIGVDEDRFWSLTPGQLGERHRAFAKREEALFERETWQTAWIMRALLGRDAPSLDQMLGKTKPNPPEDPFGEVLRLIDPQAAREREWAKSQMDS
jgi:hypothetical protein